MQIKVQLNGEPFLMDVGLTIQRWLEQQNLEANSVAIAIDEQFVPRHVYTTTEITEGQQIEIVAPMQGG